MISREDMDQSVQSSRDQGIADACAGKSPLYRMSGGLLFSCAKSGNWVIGADDPEYRSAFAYARAYAQEVG